METPPMAKTKPQSERLFEVKGIGGRAANRSELKLTGASDILGTITAAGMKIPKGATIEVTVRATVIEAGHRDDFETQDGSPFLIGTTRVHRAKCDGIWLKSWTAEDDDLQFDGKTVKAFGSGPTIEQKAEVAKVTKQEPVPAAPITVAEAVVSSPGAKAPFPVDEVGMKRAQREAEAKTDNPPENLPENQPLFPSTRPEQWSRADLNRYADHIGASRDGCKTKADVIEAIKARQATPEPEAAPTPTEEPQAADVAPQRVLAADAYGGRWVTMDADETLSAADVAELLNVHHVDVTDGTEWLCENSGTWVVWEQLEPVDPEPAPTEAPPAADFAPIGAKDPDVPYTEDQLEAMTVLQLQTVLRDAGVAGVPGDHETLVAMAMTMQD
jgi:hypothetical protein